MRLTLVVYHLYLPMCHSLKEKRKIVRGLCDRLKSRFNVSVAEVDHQDLHQNAVVAIAGVFSKGTGIESILSKIDNLVNLLSGAEILKVDRFDY